MRQGMSAHLVPSAGVHTRLEEAAAKALRLGQPTEIDGPVQTLKEPELQLRLCGTLD